MKQLATLAYGAVLGIVAVVVFLFIISYFGKL